MAWGGKLPAGYLLTPRPGRELAFGVVREGPRRSPADFGDGDAGFDVLSFAATLTVL